MKILLFPMLLLISCAGQKAIQTDILIEKSTINFILMSIKRDSTSNSEIQFISKSEVAGKIKFQPQNSFQGDNYLTIYLKNKKFTIDSITIEHPLKKHIEYLNDANNFTILDTIIN